jgi:hypothetical protein
VIFEVAHLLGLVPLCWLAVRGETRAEWWWLAVAFAVSWVADTVAHLVNPWLPAAVYPVSQAAVIGAVLLPRRDAWLFAGALVLVGIAGVLLEGVWGPDLFLETVASLGIVGIVYARPLGLLRLALLVAFGMGWLAWIGYLFVPGFPSWGVYQGVRAVSLGFFCWARERAPRLRLA